MKKEAIIIFTRVPIPQKTKTRLMSAYTPIECAELHSCFLQDIYTECKKTEKDIFIFYTPEADKNILTNLLKTEANIFPQRGENLGSRMLNAISFVLNKGFSACVLIGSDIPEINSDFLLLAFSMLGTCDVVISPVNDGGYCLIGMKKIIQEVFAVKEYGTDSVFQNTIKHLQEKQYSVKYTNFLYDIDTPQDVLKLKERISKNKNISCKNTIEYFRTHKKISVIIPIYNEVSKIISLQNELKKLDNCEIILSDGGSSDKTIDLIEKKYRIIISEKGRARQMNAAAKESIGDILFFMHADSIIPESACKEIQDVMKNFKFGSFGIYFIEKGLFFKFCAFFSNLRMKIFKIVFGDQGIFIERDLFFQVGMFPEIPLMEDYQFSLNMKKLRVRLGITENKIYTSGRRYKGSLFHKIKTSIQMFNLRRLFRKGENIYRIAKMYKDIR